MLGSHVVTVPACLNLAGRHAVILASPRNFVLIGSEASFSAHHAPRTYFLVLLVSGSRSSQLLRIWQQLVRQPDLVIRLRPCCGICLKIAVETS
jgi:hypothetical protein